jgi:hypothetical protein
MIILLTAIALLVIGTEIAIRLWPGGEEGAPGPLERATMASVMAAALWLSSTWALALLKLLTLSAISIRAAVVTVIAAAMLTRRLRGARIRDREVKLVRNVVILLIIAIVPVMAWVELILWRGAIVPPLSHDALSYHLPKAVLFAREGGFRYLTELDPRERNIPANYEMLLSELVVTQHSDVYTEWPSAAFFLLFVMGSGALAERWWGRRLAPLLVTMLLTAGAPVLLLHSGAHKNDVMTAFFMVAAMVFAGRWIRQRDVWALMLLITSIALAVGTKPQAAGFALCVAPFVLYRAVKELRPRQFAGLVVFAVAAFLLLGGVVYVVNFLEQRSLIGQSGDESVIIYGDWKNLWQGPYVLLAAPFARSPGELFVPWSERPWFWRRYEIYFSHLGIPFALCAMAMPFAAFRLRRQEGASERWAITIAALCALFLMLPVVFRPHGMYAISLPRYSLFIMPVVFGWTIAPLVARMAPRAAMGALVVAMMFFVTYAVDAAVNDRFVPLDYVLWARAHPGTRDVPFDNQRAASVVDRLAGPNDKIAFDASFASWIHPAFGAHLSRPVVFIPQGEGPPQIPDDAKWVVIDRSWGIIWGIKGFDDLSQARDRLGSGTPSASELRVRRYLVRDPRFELVYVLLGQNQLVFRRVRQ